MDLEGRAVFVDADIGSGEGFGEAGAELFGDVGLELLTQRVRE